MIGGGRHGYQYRLAGLFLLEMLKTARLLALA